MKILAAVLMLVTIAPQTEDRKIPEECRGLHAGITARVNPMYTENRTVQLGFVLLNDSDSSRDVGARSWKIVIDANELEDSGYIFGNGPQPVGGYRILKPGEHYELGTALPIPEYFSPGEHKVSWKGDGFQSPTISVAVDATSDPSK